MMDFSLFHFLRPWWLILLPFGALLVWRLRQPAGDLDAWAKICDPALLKFLTCGEGGKPARLPLLLAGMGWMLAILAIAGPTWEKRPLPLFQTEATRVVVLDLSRSMLAADLTPDRLTQARFKLADLLDRNQEGQIGLVAYAGESFVVSPLTQDAKTIKSMLGALDVSIMPVQGSELGEALVLAKQLLDGVATSRGEIFVVTDSVGKGALTAAREIFDAGHRVSVLGVGTPEGAPIPQANGGFFKATDGTIAVPRLNEIALTELAAIGGGQYVRLRTDARDLDRLLSDEGSSQSTSANDDASTESLQWREQGPWLVLLLLPIAALAFRRGWLLILPLAVLMLPPSPAVAASWLDQAFKTPDQQAAFALKAGEHEAAAAVAQDPMLRGEALYRDGQFESAAQAFSAAAGAQAHYNRGNALAMQEKYQDAIAAYDQALAENPEMADAEHNKKLLEDLLEEQEQQDQQQENQDNQEQSEGDSEQQSDEPTEQEGEEESEEPGSSEEADSEQEPEQTQPTAAEELDAEEKQALEQWLRRIPDDPGGLLRRKFQLEYQRRGQPPASDEEEW
ncbi:MAG: VWA domain-containing protein [Lysobacterales bacterium]